MWFPSKQVQQHYENNRRRDLSETMDRDGLLNGQARPGLGELHFGLARVARSGCESIAVYNALQCLGLARPLPEIIRDMERFGYLRGFGYLGAVPYFRPLLRRYGASCRTVSPKALRRRAEAGELAPGSVFIFCIWNRRWRVDRGLHSFAGVWAPDGGPGWEIFNRFDNDAARRRYDELSHILKNGSQTGAWLVIYQIEAM